MSPRNVNSNALPSGVQITSDTPPSVRAASVRASVATGLASGPASAAGEAPSRLMSVSCVGRSPAASTIHTSRKGMPSSFQRKVRRELSGDQTGRVGAVPIKLGSRVTTFSTVSGSLWPERRAVLSARTLQRTPVTTKRNRACSRRARIDGIPNSSIMGRLNGRGPLVPCFIITVTHRQRRGARLARRGANNIWIYDRRATP